MARFVSETLHGKMALGMDLWFSFSASRCTMLEYCSRWDKYSVTNSPQKPAAPRSGQTSQP